MSALLPGRMGRYLIGEALKPFLLTLGVLVFLYGGYCGASVLSDAVNGLLPLSDIAIVVALRVLISLEVLVPIALYLSVLLALTQLSSQSEISAMLALSIGPMRIASWILGLGLVLAGTIAVLSLCVRPKAYLSIHELSARADASINFRNMAAGTFFEDKDGHWMIHIGRRSGPEAPAEDVTIRIHRDGGDEIVSARELLEVADDTPTNRIRLKLRDAKVLGVPKTDEDLATDLVTGERMMLDLDSPRPHPVGYSAVASTSRELARSKDLTDIAELQWRLSTPMSTLLLAVIAIPLSRARARQGRFANMGLAIGIYVAYYLLCASARTWVQQGLLPTTPGIFLAPGLLALLGTILVISRRPNVLA